MYEHAFQFYDNIYVNQPLYVTSTLSLRYISAEGKPLSKKAIKKQQKDAEKSKKKAETAARLVSRARFIMQQLWLG